MDFDFEIVENILKFIFETKILEKVIIIKNQFIKKNSKYN